MPAISPWFLVTVLAATTAAIITLIIPSYVYAIGPSDDTGKSGTVQLAKNATGTVPFMPTLFNFTANYTGPPFTTYFISGNASNLQVASFGTYRYVWSSEIAPCVAGWHIQNQGVPLPDRVAKK